ncbi:hypothetical protein BV22DRAFT_1029430 [Leucogyrophana mollusca]|uniref:Uncharacterized protein n=1 Tax=Leucogyrophana mollusca TaxID=85980 RepID=A0ACB8BUF3_9AGAM|nr:hypothetical protein BV22DRAFT_1029430 [Leucogyrophana mollusca]
MVPCGHSGSAPTGLGNVWFCDAVANVREDCDGCLYLGTPSPRGGAHTGAAPTDSCAVPCARRREESQTKAQEPPPPTLLDRAVDRSSVIPEGMRAHEGGQDSRKYDLEGVQYAYQCHWYLDGMSCGLWVSWAKMIEHLHHYHGVTVADKQFVSCLWEDCQARMKKESVARHIAAKHLEIRSKCDVCGGEWCRNDSWQRHCQNAAKCYRAKSILVPGPNARVVDARSMHGSPVHHA